MSYYGFKPYVPAAKRRREQPLQGRNDLLELGEHEKLFLAACDGLADFPQALKFAAVVFVIGAVAQPLRRVIANLLQAHQRGQHQPPSRNPVTRLLQVFLQLADRALIKRGLLAGQMAEGFDLRLVGQIRDDALVGLKPAQDIGLHQPPQRGIGNMGLRGEGLGELREGPRGAEQTRIEEVE